MCRETNWSSTRKSARPGDDALGAVVEVDGAGAAVVFGMVILGTVSRAIREPIRRVDGGQRRWYQLMFRDER
jgi:hypothetical protein